MNNIFMMVKMKFCECGCGEEIIWKPHHKYTGTPRFLHKHGHKLFSNPKFGIKIKRETRICKCGCGEKFICRPKNKKQYIVNHYMKKFGKGRTPVKRETRICECGCDQTFICKINSKKRFIGTHRKITSRKKIRTCKCGCGKKFEIPWWHSKQYLLGHYARVQVQKGKTKEEFYGKEKALQMIESSRKKQLDISWEERYGKEEAKKRKERFIKKILSYGGGKGKNETTILNFIEKRKNIILKRQYFVNKYFVDGYDEKNNVVYEVDEIYHKKRYMKIKDKEREDIIREELGCEIVRIDEEQFMRSEGLW